MLLDFNTLNLLIDEIVKNTLSLDNSDSLKLKDIKYVNSNDNCDDYDRLYIELYDSDDNHIIKIDLVLINMLNKLMKIYTTHLYIDTKENHKFSSWIFGSYYQLNYTLKNCLTGMCFNYEDMKRCLE